MNTPKEKGSGYINIIADITLLQGVICCNTDMHKTNADTPKARKLNDEPAGTIEHTISENNIPIEIQDATL